MFYSLCKSSNSFSYRTYGAGMGQVSIAIAGSVAAVVFECGYVVLAAVRHQLTTFAYRNRENNKIFVCSTYQK